MSTTETYTVRCDCGLAHDVTIVMCGLDIPCDCGNRVRVPSSIKLRKMAGLSAVAPEPEFVISEMVKTGELPLPTCIVCGIDADAVHHWMIECQRQHAQFDRHNPSLGWVVFGPFLSLLMGPFMILRPERSFDVASEVHGRDVYVRTPYRACNVCMGSINSTLVDSLLAPLYWSTLVIGIMLLFSYPMFGTISILLAMIVSVIRHRRNLQLTSLRRSRLQTIPEFQSLFEKYPDAIITSEE